MALLSLELNSLIEGFRKTIPDDCATAIAIDHRYSRTSIAAFARNEGYLDFVRELEDVMSGYRARLQGEVHRLHEASQLN
jgi:hypothetical protein